MAWHPVLIFRYKSCGQFQGLVNAFSQLQTCTALILTADCTEVLPVFQPISCGFTINYMPLKSVHYTRYVMVCKIFFDPNFPIFWRKSLAVMLANHKTFQLTANIEDLLELQVYESLKCNKQNCHWYHSSTAQRVTLN